MGNRPHLPGRSLNLLVGVDVTPDMDTANPLANQSTIALVLLHQYADSDPYRALDPGRQALVQEAIESLTAFEESGPTWPSPPTGDDSPCDRIPSPRAHDAPTRDRIASTRDRISPTGAGDGSNQAAAGDDLITDFRVS